MKRINKMLIIFYIFLAITFSSFLFNENNSLRERYPDVMDTDPFDIFIQPIDTILAERNVPIPIDEYFNAMTDIENYPIVLPKNVASVKILNQSNNIIFAEEEIMEAGIKIKLLAKHTIHPYDEHIIEILDGDAKGTKIFQTFESLDTGGTKVSTKIDFDLKGILTPISYFPRGNFNSAIHTVLQSFSDYVEFSENKNQKIIDDLYREILLRPADETGLFYYSSQLESGNMTEADIRESLLKYGEFKDLDELENKNLKIVDDLYREILLRPADETGLFYYSSQLESGNMTEADIRESLLKSEEFKNLK